MPRIRKKTSNRGTTNNRRKIQKKVRESRKKAQKAAKKNPQWKSKKPKDPGIPNNFPFKNEVLAEIAEQRRTEIAEKLRKKEEQKALRAKTNEELAKELIELEPEAEKHQGLEFAAPTNCDLPNLQAVLDNVDVIIQVLDARDPLSFRSSHLEKVILARPRLRLLFVLNKIDTCPSEVVAAWAEYLRMEYPTFLFKSTTAFLPTTDAFVKAKGKSKIKAFVDDSVGVDSVLSCLGEWAKQKEDEPLTVAVMGIPNVGKSSFVNSLIRSNLFPIYAPGISSQTPTTTERPQETSVTFSGKQIRLIDTPGLRWHRIDAAGYDTRARDILLPSRGRIDRLKDPISVIGYIVSRSLAEDLMLFYNLPAFTEGDLTSFLLGLARSNQLNKKRGELDLGSAARILLRDWSTGRLPRYTNPPATIGSREKNEDLAKFYEDTIALETLRPLKELRRSSGLVRFICGEPDHRMIVLQDPWAGDSGISSRHGADIPGSKAQDQWEENEELGYKDHDRDHEHSEEDGDGEISVQKKPKRGRRNDVPLAPPKKRVTFASEFKVQVGKEPMNSLDKGQVRKRSQRPTSIIHQPKSPVLTKTKVANTVGKNKNTKAADVDVYDFSKYF